MATVKRKKVVRKRTIAKVVEGVRMGKFDEAVFLKAYGIALESHAQMADPPMALPPLEGNSNELLVAELVKWYRMTTPEDDLCDCSECGGDSDARLDECPYCGETDVDDDEEETEEPPEGQGDDLPDGQDEPEDGGDEPEEETADDQETPVDEGGDEQEEETPAPRGRKKASKKVSKKAKKASKKTPDEAATDSQDGEEGPGGETGIVPTDSDPDVEVVDKAALQVNDLDDAVAKVQELKAAAAMSIWHLGHEIRHIQDGQLWRLRLDDKRKTRFKTFSAFCLGELGMSYGHANRLMTTSAAFTEELMTRVGVAKCAIALTVPPEHRADLLTGAEGRSAAELTDDARALKDKELPKAPAKGALTVAMAPGVTEIVLMARPKANARKGSDKPAKTLAQDPWAREQLPNKVHVYYAVTRNKEGEMVLRIERRRVNSEELFHAEEEVAEEEEGE